MFGLFGIAWPSISVVSSPMADIAWYNNIQDRVLESDGGHTLTAVSGVNGSWNQRNLWSDQVSTLGETEVEFYMSNVNDDPLGNLGDCMFGLSNITKNANNFSDIDFAIYKSNSNSQLYVFENGVLMHTLNVVGGIQFKCKIIIIEIVGLKIVRYHYNNVLFYTSLINPVFEVKFKTSFNDNFFSKVNSIAVTS